MQYLRELVFVNILLLGLWLPLVPDLQTLVLQRHVKIGHSLIHMKGTFVLSLNGGLTYKSGTFLLYRDLSFSLVADLNKPRFQNKVLP